MNPAGNISTQRVGGGLLLLLPSPNSSSSSSSWWALELPATAAAGDMDHNQSDHNHSLNHSHNRNVSRAEFDAGDPVSALVVAVVLSVMFVVGVAGNLYTLILMVRHSLRPAPCWNRLFITRHSPPAQPQHHHHQHHHNHDNHRLYSSVAPPTISQQQQLSASVAAVSASSFRRRSGSSTSSMYVYVLNLALADLLYLATAPFVACANVARTWNFGDAGCRLLISSDLLTTHASAFILTAMSVERYAAVQRPLLSLRRGRTPRRLVVLAAWVAALALALPGMVMVRMREVVFDGGATSTGARSVVVKHTCEPTWSEDAHRLYVSVLFATAILGPGVIIGCVYAKLARAYWASQTLGGLGRCGKAAGRSPPPKHKVLYLILAIVLAFWACFLPFWLWQLLQLYRPDVAHASVRTARCVNHFVSCLTYGNSCFNPFLYTLLTNKYKEYVRMRGGSRCRMRGVSTRVGADGALGAPGRWLGRRSIRGPGSSEVRGETLGLGETPARGEILTLSRLGFGKDDPSYVVDQEGI